MELKRKKVEVVMLPSIVKTEKFGKTLIIAKGSIYTKDKDDIIRLANTRIEFDKGDYTIHELYFVIDDVPKHNELCVFTNIHDTQFVAVFDENDSYHAKKCRKLIGSTDKSITMQVIDKQESFTGYSNINFPKPSNSFVEKYCRLGGIDKVLVEYEYLLNDNGVIPYLKLKIDSHNTITIHPINKSITSTEVEKLIWDFHKDYGITGLELEVRAWIDKKIYSE